MATPKTPKKTGAGKKKAAGAAKKAAPGSAVAPVAAKAASEKSSMVAKKDIINEVVAETGLRRGQVKKALEGYFALANKWLNEGKDLQCAPLGKIKVIKRNEGQATEKQIYKVVLKDLSAPAKAPEPKKEPITLQEALAQAESSK